MFLRGRFNRRLLWVHWILKEPVGFSRLGRSQIVDGMNDETEPGRQHDSGRTGWLGPV